MGHGFRIAVHRPPGEVLGAQLPDEDRDVELVLVLLPKTGKRRIKQLETELAVSRKVNEVFLEGELPPKGSSR
jgi:hypothetical protein